MRTCDRPNFESERSSIMPGSPAIWLSMGRVTSFSISSGASAGTAVLTSTCGFVMSGTESIGSRSADQMPMPTRTSVASNTTARWRSESSMVLRTMLFPLWRCDAAGLSAFDGPEFRQPQRHDRLQHHLVARVKAVLDLSELGVDRADLDRRAH